MRSGFQGTVRKFYYDSSGHSRDNHDRNNPFYNLLYDNHDQIINHYTNNNYTDNYYITNHYNRLREGRPEVCLQNVDCRRRGVRVSVQTEEARLVHVCEGQEKEEEPVLLSDC